MEKLFIPILANYVSPCIKGSIRIHNLTNVQTNIVTQIKKQIDKKMSPVSSEAQMLNCNNKNDQNQNCDSLFLQEISLPVISRANSDFDRKLDSILELGSVAPKRRFLFSPSQNVFESDNFGYTKSIKMDE